MDLLKQAMLQFRKLSESMSALQRATLLAVPAAGVAFLCMLIAGHSSSSAPVLAGKALTKQELDAAEVALRSAGLADFRREGNTLVVPSRQADRYNLAVLRGKSEPSGWAGELEKQFRDESVFSSDKSSQTRKDIALARALEQMIRGSADIEEAHVFLARSKSKRYHGDPPVVSATVSIRNRGDQELSPVRVAGLRAAVASAVGELNPENVVVFDEHHLKAYSTEPGVDPVANLLLARVDEGKQQLQQSITQALSYIPGVLVTVTIDVNRVKSQLPPDGAGAEADLIDIMAKSAGVSVQVPKEYVRSQAAQQSLRRDSRGRISRFQLETAQAKVEDGVRRAVIDIIGAGASPDAVQFGESDAGPTAGTEKAEISNAGAHVEENSRQWLGGGVALAALWAFWLFKKGNRKVEVPQGTHSEILATSLPTVSVTKDSDPFAALLGSMQEAPVDDDQPFDAELQRALAESEIANDTGSVRSIPGPFEFLKQVDIHHLKSVFADEHPQTVAVILSYLPSTLAAEVLEGLSSQKRTDIMRRLSSIEATNADVIRDIESSLEQRLATIDESAELDFDGHTESFEPLAVQATVFSPAEIIEDKRQERPAFVGPLLTEFQELARLDDSALRALIGEVDNRQWAVALRGASDDVKRRIFNVLPERRMQLVTNRIKQLGPIRLRDMENMQQQVVETANLLADSGSIPAR